MLNAIRNLKNIFLRRKSSLSGLTISKTEDGFWVVEDDGYGLTYTGPYKREQDAKGVRTRLIKQRG